MFLKLKSDCWWVRLGPMCFWGWCWPTGEQSQVPGSRCNILSQVLGPLLGRDGSQVAEGSGVLRQPTSLWVGLCLHSNNCLAWSVPELVPTCWGGGSYHGSNKLEGGFQIGICQHQSLCGMSSQQWLLPPSVSPG